MVNVIINVTSDSQETLTIEGDSNKDTSCLEISIPHSPDAERTILASMMLDIEICKQADDELVSEHFYIEKNRIIFDCIIDLLTRRKLVDVLMIKEQIECNNDLALLNLCGGEDYLSQLAKSEPDTINVHYYIELVREKYLLRKLLSAYSDLSKNINENIGYSVTEHLNKAQEYLLNISVELSQYNPIFNKIGSLMADAYNELQDRCKNQQAVTGVATGFKDLDELTAGMQSGDLIVVAGRPTMGKTSFSINLAINAAIHSDEPQVAAIFSLEMGAEQIAMRILAVEGRVDLGNFRTGRFSADDWRKLATASSSLSEAEIFIDDTPALSVLDIRSKCRRLKLESKRLDLVLIDCLQLMSGFSGAMGREQDISEITRSLKDLAKELDVPVIVLSQVNRSVDGRSDKRPMMSDLRGSGAIELDADIIMFLYRDEVYNKKPENEGLAELIVAKQRNGDIGTVKLTFLAKYTRFEDREIDTF